MEAKLLEIRDVGTFIPAVAIQLKSGSLGDEYLLARSGFSRECPLGGYWYILVPLASLPRTTYSSHRGDRTYDSVYQYLSVHWNDLQSGDVLDVEYILGETPEPKASEALRLVPVRVGEFTL